MAEQAGLHVWRRRVVGTRGTKGWCPLGGHSMRYDGMDKSAPSPRPELTSDGCLEAAMRLGTLGTMRLGAMRLGTSRGHPCLPDRTMHRAQLRLAHPDVGLCSLRSLAPREPRHAGTVLRACIIRTHENVRTHRRQFPVPVPGTSGVPGFRGSEISCS